MGPLLRRLALCLLLLGAVCATPASAANPAPLYDFVEVADGTEIAVSIWFPEGASPTDGRRHPALFEMDGYGGARNVNDTQFAGRSKDFVVIYASVRGSGCSGGRFDLFGPQTAQDGYDVIERWLVEQPWSDGRVGITGHSYSGLTGLAVAEKAPPHVRGVAVSGLFDDLYRGLLATGGVPNVGFPVVWGGAARPALEAQANAMGQVAEDRCRANFLEHEGSDYVASPQLFLDTYGEDEAREESFFIQRGLMRGIGAVDAPTQIGHQWQDEQTGPRGGPVLWQHLRDGLPKRLVLSNGRHNPNDPTGTKDDWLRCWVIAAGKGCGAVTAPAERVLLFVDSRKKANGSGQERSAVLKGSTFPLPRTEWRRWNLEPRSYVSTSGDYHVTLNTGLVFSEDTGVGGTTFALDAPAQARWTLPFDRHTLVAGPIALTLWAVTRTPDTDFFVDVLDHDTRSGELRYLQRGLQRASFRRVDEARSDRVASGSEQGSVFRPYHDFVDPSPVPAGVPQRYEIEIHPVAHVFRPGHELVLQLHAPPPNDPLSIGTFAPTTLPGPVQVLGDAEHRSSVLLPVQPRIPGGWTPASCVRVAGELCLVKPSGPADESGVPPDAATPPVRCASRRDFVIRLRRDLRSARVTVGGRPVKVLRGPRLRARVRLTGKPKGTTVVRITGRTRSGKVVRETRRYRRCAARPS